MRHILATENREILTRYASLPTVYAFDFDGTLAPIVADPKRACMRPETSALFVELAQKRPCAIVTGRQRSDVVKRLDDALIIDVIANHGIESLRMDATFALAMADVRAVMHTLESLEGVFVEDKTFTLAVHYRRAPDTAAAREAVYEILRTLPQVRLLGGELVVNVVPKDAPHKGDAMLALMKRGTFDAAVYVGDDETDEDVFRLRAPPEILKVRVGHSTASKADFFLEHQREIDLLLDVLLGAQAGVQQ